MHPVNVGNTLFTLNFYGVIMSIAKQEVSVLLENLPDSCTLEDIQYHLYVLEKIQKGIQRSEEEGTIDHDEVEKRIKKWLKK